MTDRELVLMAIKAMQESYSPYSNHTVGAALLTKSGKVYLGCNIENAAYSPTNCAERTAFFKAVSEGEREFCKIAVAGGYKLKVSGAFPPCGVCRQVMAEFCEPDFKILVAKNEAEYDEYTLGALLPQAFTPNNIN